MTTEGVPKMNEELALRRQLLTLWEKMADQISQLFLRRHILVPEMEKILRWRATDVALNNPEFAPVNGGGDTQQSFSHAAVVTGLTRQEMARADQESNAQSPVPLDGGSLHRMIRILTAWRTDPGYQDENGHPIDLPLQGATPAFHRLCRKYGRDTPTKPIADALVKNGNAEWIGDIENGKQGKMLRYVHPVITAEILSEKGMAILTQVVSDFAHSMQATFDSNALTKPRLREGYFNDIALEHAEEAQQFLHKELQEFTLRCSEGLRKYRATQGDAGVRLGVGAYSFRDAPLVMEQTENPETLAQGKE